MEEKTLSYSNVSPFEFQIKYVDINSENPANVYDSHSHEECEIYINLTGDVSFMVENRIYPIRSGSVIITRPYEYHHCIYHSNAIHNHFWVLFSAVGNEEMLKLFFNRAQGEKNLIELSEIQKNKVTKLCLKLIRENRSAVASYSDFFTLLSILENADDKTPAVFADVPKDIEIAVEYIGENLGNTFTVSDVANAAHISVNTLERRFAKVLHMTPSGYIKQRRLARATELLSVCSSVGEVCEKCGFCDYSNFISLFRRQFGVTPLKYKNLHCREKSSYITESED